MGKRGGVRVVYALFPVSGTVLLMTIYSKSACDTLPADFLRKLLEVGK